MRGVIWISWESHRRTIEICDHLSIDLHLIKVSNKKPVIRYFKQIYRTHRIIRTNRPKVLLVQNPSIVLTMFALFLRPIYRYKLVVDAHNEAVQPYVHDNWLVRLVSSFLLRKADLTIVTNSYLEKDVLDKKGKAFVLPDKLPKIGDMNRVTLPENTFNIILIATYAADEPITNIIDAAADLHGSLTLYVTGDYTRLEQNYRDELPSNIIFTGYLSNEDYWGYLKSVDAIVDLTSMNDCLVCGAYEGVAVEKPLMLSNNRATVEYFNKGVIYADNTIKDINRAFLDLIQNHASLRKEITRLNNEIPADWQVQADRMKYVITKWL